MIIINKDSWHYRAHQSIRDHSILKGWNDAVPSNLCDYVRKLITYVLFGLPVFAAFVILIGWLILCGAAFLAQTHLHIELDGVGIVGDVIVTFVFTALLALVILALVIFVVVKMTVVSTRSRSLLGQWFKDKHDKVCRNLTFK